MGSTTHLTAAQATVVLGIPAATLLWVVITQALTATAALCVRLLRVRLHRRATTCLRRGAAVIHRARQRMMDFTTLHTATRRTVARRRGVPMHLLECSTTDRMWMLTSVL